MKNTKSKYYNQEIKEKFINEYATQYDSYVEKYKTVFSISYDTEKFFKADLAELTTEELIGLFTNAYWTKSNFKARKGLIKKYVQWYKENINNNVNLLNIENVEADVVLNRSQLRRTFFKDLSDLMNCCDEVLSTMNCDKAYIDQYKMFLGLMWSGIDYRYLNQIKKQDLIRQEDGTANVHITHYNKKYVYNIEKQLADICFESFDYLTCKARVTKYFQDNDFLIRGCYARPSLAATNQDTIINMEGYFSNKKISWKKRLESLPNSSVYKFTELSQTDITYSGLFYRFFKMNGNTNNEELIHQYIANETGMVKDTVDILVGTYFGWRKYFYGI